MPASFRCAHSAGAEAKGDRSASRSGFIHAAHDLPHDAALAIEWRFAAGHLRLLMNFGDDVVEALVAGNERLLWSSEAAVRQDGCVHLTRWTGAFIKSARPRMNIPRATYRLQFHKDFTFDHAIEIVPYLARLGISHIYSSPITQARPGSMHGYDIVDHGKINPELGGEEGSCACRTC